MKIIRHEVKLNKFYVSVCAWRGEGGVGVRVSRRVVVAGSVAVVAVVAVAALCAVLIPSGKEGRKELRAGRTAH